MIRSFSIVLVCLGLCISPAVMAADAAATFKTKCASCHGADGGGDTAMGRKMGVRSLASQEVQEQTDAVLQEIIEKGKGKMPGYAGKIPEAEIKGLVKLIRTFPTK